MAKSTPTLTALAERIRRLQAGADAALKRATAGQKAADTPTSGKKA